MKNYDNIYTFKAFHWKIIKLLLGYQNNFRIEKGSDSGKWQLKIDHKLSDETLTKHTELLIIMTVKDGKSSKDDSVLVLKLPKEAGEQTLTFKKAFYIANYSKAAIGPVDFDESIEFTNLLDSSKVHFSLSGKFK